MNIGKLFLVQDFLTFVKTKKKLWFLILASFLLVFIVLIIIGAGNLFAPSSYTSF